MFPLSAETRSNRMRNLDFSSCAKRSPAPCRLSDNSNFGKSANVNSMTYEAKIKIVIVGQPIWSGVSH
jgi:hypothetical protein